MLCSPPDQCTWLGRRDHTTFGSLGCAEASDSEMTGLNPRGLAFGAALTSRHCKGRKDRCTPLPDPTRAWVKAWLRDAAPGYGNTVPQYQRHTSHTFTGVQYLLNKSIG